MSACAAVQHGDEMQCGRCGLTWDVADPERPSCAPTFDRRAFSSRKVTTAVQRVEESLENAVSSRSDRRQYPRVDLVRPHAGPPASPRLHGCNGKPRPALGQVTHIAQSGWSEVFFDGFGAPHRTPVSVEIKHPFDNALCPHGQSAAGLADRACTGCPSRRG